MSGKATKREARLVGIRRRSRAGLLRSTALQAAVLVAIELPGGVLPAAAQPAPNARPQGGQVVAGQASISQSPTTTTIDQSSQRAAVNWTSFNVGSSQTVDFQQPSSSAWTLNRVTGADPSQIAGHIEANGNIVLTNPSGVVFYRGSEVNAQSVVISAPGITNQNFMAGRMVFDQLPHPNARVINAGSITVKQAGLAALVAPQVANSGVITAKLGHVVLAGARTDTLDMYGDGLLSFDVTGEVRQAPRGPDGKPATALVTDTGTVLASGGTVQLTARAADGIVQNLVDAKGRIAADTAGARTGAIVINGTGGSIQIAGNIAANGPGAAQHGGQIELNATRSVVLANSARVSASGGAGGGTAAVGTTLARAIGGPSVTPKLTARRTVIARGATITADATKLGNGGKITVLSKRATAMAGTITARGGPQGGNGGDVEVSGQAALNLPGMIDVSAPIGNLGNILLDPTNLLITNASDPNVTLNDNTDPNLAFGARPPDDAIVNPFQIEALHGNVHLEATNSIDIAASISLTAANPNLTLEAGGSLTVESGNAEVPVVITAPGNIVLIAASPNSPVRHPGGGLAILSGSSASGQVIAGGDVTLTAGTGGITVAGIVSGGPLVSLKTPGTTVVTGSVTAQSVNGTIALETDNLSIGVSGVLRAGFGNGLVSIAPDTAGRPILLTTSAASPASTLTVHQSDIDQIDAGTLEIGSLKAGPITVGQAGETIDMASGVSSPPGAGFNTVVLLSGADITEPGALVVHSTQGGGNTLQGSSGGSTTLNSPGNTIDDLGSFTSAGDFAFTNSATTTLVGLVSVGSNGHTLALTQDALRFAEGALSAPGGKVALAPLTAGRPVELGSASNSNTLSISPFDLSSVTAATLEIGSPSAGPVNIGDNFSGSPQTIDLVHLTNPIPTLRVVSGAAVTEGGVLVVGTLQGSVQGSPGSAILGNGNSIATLGSFSATGGFALTDATGLTVAGPVIDPPGITLNVSGPLAISGLISAPDVSLTATGAISEPGGTIVTGMLSGSGGASVSLTNNTNSIDSIGSLGFSAAGDFALTDQTGLAVNGFLNAGNIALALGGDLTIASGIEGATVSLTTPGAITEPSGFIATSTLTGSAASASLTRSNEVGTLGSFTTGTGFALVDGEALTVAGPVAAGVSIALTSAGPLTVAGAVGAPTVSLTANSATLDSGGSIIPGDIIETAGGSIGGSTGVVLTASGSIEQAGGVLTAGALSGSSDLTTTLPSAGNAVANLGSFTSTGGFTLRDGEGLAVSGPVTDSASIALNVTGGLTLSGVLDAPAVSLLASGDIAQTGGGIITSALRGDSGGATSLTSAGNSVTNLDSFTSGGDFVLADSVPVRFAGPVTVGSGHTLTVEDNQFIIGAAGVLSASLGTIVLEPLTPGTPFGLTGTGAALPFTANTLVLGSPTAGPVTISNDVNLAGVSTLDLLSGVSIGEAASTTLTVGALEGFSGGPASFTATNNIAVLGSFSTSGGFAMRDAEALTVSGPVTDTSLAGVALNVAGALTLAGSLSAPDVTLVASGAIAEAPSAVLTAGALAGSGTSAAFTATNKIATLGSFSTSGGFVMSDAEALTVSGPVTDTSLAGVALNAAGALTLAGNLSAPNVALVASGAIVQQSGTFTAGSLTASASGVASFGGNSSIAAVGTLGPVAVQSGTFALTDSDALRINGPLSADDIAVSATGTMVLAGGTITTLGLPLAQQFGAQPAAPGSFLQVLPGSGGTAQFVQLGVTVIDPPNGVVPTLRIQVADSGGSITLNDLVGLTANLVLANFSGPNSGIIDVGSLSVIGATGLANLFGSVAGNTGPTAARISVITPAINSNYLLNDCVIMAATCGAAIPTPPGGPPIAGGPPGTQAPPGSGVAPTLPGTETPPGSGVSPGSGVTPLTLIPGLTGLDPQLLLPPDTLGQGFQPGEDEIAADPASSEAAVRLGLGQPLIAGVAPPECRSLGSLDTLTSDCLDLILPNISDRDY